MATTLTALKAVLCGSDGTQGIIQDDSYYSGITTRINDAVEAIAAGVRMPDGSMSPPLPDLYATDTVATSTTLPYVSLPTDYQRHVFMVADDNSDQLYPPKGGGYYDFAMFLRQASHKDLTQSGSVSVVCVKGSSLYYQGIPSAAETLTVHYYREPDAMVDGTDAPDGIPGHLQTRLIKHYVAKEIFGEGIEDGDDSRGTGFKYHTAKFYEAMNDLIDFIGIDAEPQYYGVGDYVDLGACD